MYPDSSENLNKETVDAIYFFTPAFYPLDNYSAHSINLWGQKFQTAEHAYQWKKFSESSPRISAEILLADSPESVKNISEKNISNTPDGWNERRVSVMKEVLEAKTHQHHDVRQVLNKTGTKTIYENSPVDSFWGTGPKNDGQNIVGKLWMEIRDSINN